MNQPAAKIARPGTGRLQWERGWIAGTVGGSSWLGFSAVALAARGDNVASAISAACWVLVVGLACWLWVRRDRIDPFHALAAILLLMSIVMPIVWFTGWDEPTNDRLASLAWVRAFNATIACSIAPFILLCFYLRERLATHG